MCHNCKKKAKATSKLFCKSRSAVDQLTETTEVHSLVTSESAEESVENSYLGMIHEGDRLQGRI